MPLPKNQFPECDGCINAKLDPFRCHGCKNGSNYEGEELLDSDSSEEITSYELQMMFGDQ